MTEQAAATGSFTPVRCAVTVPLSPERAFALFTEGFFSWWPHGHILGWEHTFVHEISHLLDAIVNNKDVAPYGATFEDGYRNAVICDAIVQSSLEGRRIAIEY